MLAHKSEEPKYNILLIDDDVEYLELMNSILESSYTILKASYWQEALEIIKNKTPNLILLDIRMKDKDGVEICQTLRENTNTKQIPIIMVTASHDAESRIRAFSAGADDYIFKPFTNLELISRIKSKIRRIEENNNLKPEVLHCGNLAINLEMQKAFLDDEFIDLTAHELKLLIYMIKNKDKVQNREQIINEVWKDRHVVGRAVDTHMSALRRKLEKFNHKFENVYGRGYILTSK